MRVRQGINTGLVVVGSIGTDLRMDYTAVGDTTNVAARMQQVADSGRIVVAEAAHRLVDGYFHTRPLGALSVKGKTDPVQAWEVIAARTPRTRLDVETERGLTPFVGRDEELRALTECLDKVKAGHGQVVFIVGEPGIGKSRFLLEFRRRIGEEATWIEGRSMSFGRSIAFHPLIDLLRRTFRIEEADTETVIVEKIERGVLRLGEDLRSTLPYLRYLLAVDPVIPRCWGSSLSSAGPRYSMRCGGCSSGLPRCGPRSSCSRIFTGATKRPKSSSALMADIITTQPGSHDPDLSSGIRGAARGPLVLHAPGPELALRSRERADGPGYVGRSRKCPTSSRR